VPFPVAFNVMQTGKLFFKKNNKFFLMIFMGFLEPGSFCIAQADLKGMSVPSAGTTGVRDHAR
jgi:hypothetical protein